MSRRWTMDEDLFLADYFDSIGDFVGEHDLGRPRGAATKRVRVLKESGAWDWLKMIRRAEREYRYATGTQTVLDTESRMMERAGASSVVGIVDKMAQRAGAKRLSL